MNPGTLMPDCLTVDELTAFFPQSRNQNDLKHTTSLENHMEVLVTSSLIPDELIRINVSGSNSSGYHND